VSGVLMLLTVLGCWHFGIKCEVTMFYTPRHGAV